MKGIILVGVGRNLNRAIRTAYSFGVCDIYCLNCTGKVEGNLFSAAGKVRIHEIKSLAEIGSKNILGLEVTKSLPPIETFGDDDIDHIAIGGESVTLRQADFPKMARIPTINNLCLTTEAALALALYVLTSNEGGNLDNHG